jgi:hypothetical protein
MKVKCEIVIDLESGDYEMTVRNLSKPGESMDLLRIRRALEAIFPDVTRQASARVEGSRSRH